jgi:CelD/BcsL family acetyltransferase involved in cellulose biosynthesis
MDLTFQIITKFEDLIRLEQSWKQLEIDDPDCPIMGSFDWIKQWWETFSTASSRDLGCKKDLLIICAFFEHQLVAVAPFIKVERRQLGITTKWVEFLGQQWGGLYQDIIKHPNIHLRIDMLIEILRSHTKFDVLFLKQIPARTTRFPRDRLTPYAACPELVLGCYSNFDEFLASCSKKLRGNLRQGVSRMKREGFKVDMLAERVDEEIIHAMKNISRSKILDNKRWLWGDSLKEHFYRSLFLKFDSFAAMLKIDDQPVVYFANLLFKSRAYCIDGAYDRSYPRYELGNLSVHQSIRTSFDLGLKSICMGPGLDEYKLRQANHLENLCVYIERGNTLRGIAIGWLVSRAAHKRSHLFQRSLESVSLLREPVKPGDAKLQEQTSHA